MSSLFFILQFTDLVNWIGLHKNLEHVGLSKKNSVSLLAKY